jgi:hypothetical protein
LPQVRTRMLSICSCRPASLSWACKYETKTA